MALIHEKLKDKDVAGITKITRKISVPILPKDEDKILRILLPTMPPNLFIK